ncbi:hypothetical protein D3C85_995280 [compost metagenome]
MDRQGLRGTGAVARQVDDTGIVQRSQLPGDGGADAAVGGGQGAAAIDGEGTGAAVTVAENKVAGQVECCAIGQKYRFPANVAAGCSRGAAVEGQLISTQAAVHDGGCRQSVFSEIADRGGVIAIAHQHRRLDGGAVLPGEAIVAFAGTDFPADFATSDSDAVIAATDADVAADPATGDEDGVEAKAGDQVADDRAAGHVEEIIVELHVDTANAAAGHFRGIAIFEGTGDGAAAHEEKVSTVPLGQ